MLNSFFRKILERRNVSFIFAVSFLLVASGFAWAYSALRSLQTPIILHFSNITGIDRIGGIEDVIEYGIFGMCVVLVNAAVGIALEPRDNFLSKTIALATLVMAILLFILFAVIISVN
ncbi:MAG: hypothetical protein V1489_01065 [Candidatus Liptonbacteria bacterium]